MREIALLDKLFKKGDILIYSLSVFLVLLLFFAVSFLSKDNYNGFEVTLNGSLAFSYDFSTKSGNVKSGYEDNVIKIDENSYKIYSENGYNTIIIDNDKQDVYVSETDCGNSKECMMFSARQGVIICAPHKLVVRLSGKSDGNVKIG